MFFPVLEGCYAVELFEQAVKIGEVIKTDGEADAGYGFVVVVEQAAGVVDAYLVEEIDIGFAGTGFEVFAEGFHGEIGNGRGFFEPDGAVVFAEGKFKHFIEAAAVEGFDGGLEQLLR